MKASPVRHNAAQNRFEMDTPAGLAVADYRLEGNVLTIYHTEVPMPLRGRGYGYHLVRGTLEEVPCGSTSNSCRNAGSCGRSSTGGPSFRSAGLRI
jgi:hypothetical protein